MKGLVYALTILFVVILTACSGAAPVASQAGATATTPPVEPTASPTPTVAPTNTTMPTAAAIPTQTPLAPTATPTQMPPTPEPAGHQHGGPTTQADIELFQFKPDPIEIAAGTTVVWTNQDDIEHSVTHGVPPTPGDAFDSGLFPRGESFSFTFDRAGEYRYFCTRHTSMQGLVRVTP